MNHTPASNRPFFFIKRLIQILMVAKKNEAVEITRRLNGYLPYRVTPVPSATDAHTLLSSGGRFHVCLCDLDLFDADEQGFSLLEEFSSAIPFIVMTKRDSLEQGFKIRNIGAFAAIKNSIDFTQQSAIDLINEAFFQGIIKYRCCKKTKPIILDAITIFIEHKPMRVKEWVEKLGVEERYLRRVWMDTFGFQPRFAILLRRLLDDAFDHFNYLYYKNASLCAKGEKSFHIYSDEDFEYHNQRFYAIYDKHQSKLESILKD